MSGDEFRAFAGRGFRLGGEREDVAAVPGSWGCSWQGMLDDGMPDGVPAAQDDAVPAAQSDAVAPAAQSGAVVPFEESQETPYTGRDPDYMNSNAETHVPDNSDEVAHLMAAEMIDHAETLRECSILLIALMARMKHKSFAKIRSDIDDCAMDLMTYSTHLEEHATTTNLRKLRQATKNTMHEVPRMQSKFHELYKLGQSILEASAKSNQEISSEEDDIVIYPDAKSSAKNDAPLADADASERKRRKSQ